MNLLIGLDLIVGMSFLILGTLYLFKWLTRRG